MEEHKTQRLAEKSEYPVFLSLNDWVMTKVLIISERKRRDNPLRRKALEAIKAGGQFTV